MSEKSREELLLEYLQGYARGQEANVRKVVDEIVSDLIAQGVIPPLNEEAKEALVHWGISQLR